MRIAVLWMAWIYAGVVAFGVARRINDKSDMITALADATLEVKLYVGIWVLGSIVLCALLMTTLRQVFGARKTSEPKS